MRRNTFGDQAGAFADRCLNSLAEQMMCAVTRKRIPTRRSAAKHGSTAGHLRLQSIRTATVLGCVGRGCIPASRVVCCCPKPTHCVRSGLCPRMASHSTAALSQYRFPPTAPTRRRKSRTLIACMNRGARNPTAPFAETTTLRTSEPSVVDAAPLGTHCSDYPSGHNCNLDDSSNRIARQGARHRKNGSSFAA